MTAGLFQTAGRKRFLAVGVITVRVSAHGIGHAFPTGDLFRTLRVHLSDPEQNAEQVLELRHFFVTSTAPEQQNGAPLKWRVAEEVLPPPKSDYASLREYHVVWPSHSRRVTAELYAEFPLTAYVPSPPEYSA